MNDQAKEIINELYREQISKDIQPIMEEEKIAIGLKCIELNILETMSKDVCVRTKNRKFRNWMNNYTYNVYFAS